MRILEVDDYGQDLSFGLQRRGKLCAVVAAGRALCSCEGTTTRRRKHETVAMTCPDSDDEE